MSCTYLRPSVRVWLCFCVCIFFYLSNVTLQVKVKDYIGLQWRAQTAAVDAWLWKQGLDELHIVFWLLKYEYWLARRRLLRRLAEVRRRVLFLAFEESGSIPGASGRVNLCFKYLGTWADLSLVGRTFTSWLHNDPTRYGALFSPVRRLLSKWFVTNKNVPSRRNFAEKGTDVTLVHSNVFPWRLKLGYTLSVGCRIKLVNTLFQPKCALGLAIRMFILRLYQIVSLPTRRAFKA